jgi:hypothetical protein
MKTKCFFFTATLIAMMIAHTLSSLAFACPDGDDDEEVIDLTVDPAGTPLMRSLNQGISAVINSTTNLLFIDFLSNLGEVTIRLTNLTTGGIASTLVDSSCGGCILPVTGGPGLYCLEFLLSDGTRYYGYFLIP